MVYCKVVVIKITTLFAVMTTVQEGKILKGQEIQDMGPDILLSLPRASKVELRLNFMLLSTDTVWRNC